MKKRLNLEIYKVRSFCIKVKFGYMENYSIYVKMLRLDLVDKVGKQGV